MVHLFRVASRLRSDEQGATAIEYGLLAALVAVAVIGAVTSLSDELYTQFNTVQTEFSETVTE